MVITLLLILLACAEILVVCTQTWGGLCVLGISHQIARNRCGQRSNDRALFVAQLTIKHTARAEMRIIHGLFHGLNDRTAAICRFKHRRPMGRGLARDDCDDTLARGLWIGNIISQRVGQINRLAENVPKLFL